MQISTIIAREILDSRGNPTIECDLILDDGSLHRAMVPSGASTGAHEAVELRDGKKRFGGKGVLKAVGNVNKIIAPAIKGKDPTTQKELDQLMNGLDGTPNKAKLGANAILSVSMALARAGAYATKTPLHIYIAKLSGQKGAFHPIPAMNVINGGKHAGQDNDVQEHMIIPIGAKSFSEALQMCVEVYHQLQSDLKKKFGSQGTLIGDEGGFAPPIKDLNERLTILWNAVKAAGYEKKIRLGLDCAASEFYVNGKYTIGSVSYTSAELVAFYESLIKKFPIISIEDGHAEDDWQGWQLMAKKLGSKIQIVGDDLLVTNPIRMQKAIKEKSCNALLLKLNQIGTVSEAIDAALLAKKNNWGIMVSHRSGETEDAFIADFCVGIDAKQSKFGAPARSERAAKYNQLLRIDAKYPTNVF